MSDTGDRQGRPVPRTTPRHVRRVGLKENAGRHKGVPYATGSGSVATRQGLSYTPTPDALIVANETLYAFGPNGDVRSRDGDL